MSTHVNPHDIMSVPGAAPGGHLGFDLARWLPVLLKVMDLFKTGRGYLSTNVPGFGKRYLILSDTLPEGF